MADQPTPDAEARARLIAAAREATGKLRDAARLGTIIEFRQRDELVVAIHRALDLLAADGEAHDYLQQRCSAHPSDPLELVCVRCFESEKTAAARPASDRFRWRQTPGRTKQPHGRCVKPDEG